MCLILSLLGKQLFIILRSSIDSEVILIAIAVYHCELLIKRAGHVVFFFSSLLFFFFLCREEKRRNHMQKQFFYFSLSAGILFFFFSLSVVPL